MEKEKVQAILDWPQLQHVKALCGFLGLANFYKKFICDFELLQLL